MNMRACAWCLLSCLAAADTGRRLGYVMANSNIYTARDAWLADPTAAEATYGHISTWDTSGVTDMKNLFCAYSEWSSDGCNTAAASFNEDIGAWDTSAVTRMSFMFYEASAFNQDISGWAVDSVTDMSSMFWDASSFDQDLGWCVDDDVHMWAAFSYSGCQLTSSSSSCGVEVVGDLSDCPAPPTPRPTLHHPTPRPTPQPTTAAPTVDPCGELLVPVAGGECPGDPDLATCDVVACGELCEGDGECGTDGGLNNCASFDVYRKYCGAATLAPTLAPTTSLAPTATSAPTATPLVADDSTIRTAAALWFSNRRTAIRTYGHISTWETGGVTDMSYLFCAFFCGSDSKPAAASFNEDIGAWDTSGVTTMEQMFQYASVFDQDIGAWDTSGVRTMSHMFYRASVFNRDIGGWAVHSVEGMRSMFYYAAAFNQDIGTWDTSGVTTMYRMFYGASAFDQDLGWCVDDDVSLEDAFSNTPCESTSCGVVQALGACWDGTPYVMTDSNIKTAVVAWFSDATAAEVTYGHISTWETGGVTDMSELFCAQDCSYSNSAAASFNEDIGAWDTSGVTSMYVMFQYASAFDQDIGGWAVRSVTSINRMFYQASSFDQDLGWCVPDTFDLIYANAFEGTQCESTSCGVVQGPLDSNGNCQQQLKEKSSSSGGGGDGDGVNVALIAGVAAAAALLLAIGAFCWYRRQKGPEPKKQTEAMPTKDEEAAAVAPEAEESPQEILAEEAPPAPPARGWSWRAETEPEAEEAERPPPAKGWFSAAEPEGEAGSSPFAPEAEDAVAAAERPPPPGNSFSRAAPEPEPEFEAEPEC